ncbi:MAG: CheR family methyltransferase [Solirubrobacterales bacterium]
MDVPAKTLQKYSDFLYETTGILYGKPKQSVLRGKLARLLARKNLESADDFLKHILSPGHAHDCQDFIDAMTTNTTEFFREPDHFEYIEAQLPSIMARNPRIERSRTIRVWSAACSTGQEPVTIAMVLSRQLPKDIQIRILATDVSTQALVKAIRGHYSESDVQGIPQKQLKRHFTPYEGGHQVSEEIRALITYRQFNLQSEFRFKHGFDLIFCRNVMIYFDYNIQQALTDKFYNQLVPGGLLFVGHAESLFNKSHRFHSIGHSIYLKEY